MNGLTARQAKTLAFIEAYTVERDGMAPTYDEIASHLGLASRSGAYRMVEQLVQRGHLRRFRHRTRTLEVVWPAAPSKTKTEIANEVCRLVWEWSGRSRPTDSLMPLVLRALS